MKIKTKERKKLLINNKKHLKRKQNSFLQLETLSHYRNRRIRLHYKNDTLIKRRINNVYVKNHESNKIKLRNLRERNVGYYLSN